MSRQLGLSVSDTLRTVSVAVHCASAVGAHKLLQGWRWSGRSSLSSASGSGTQGWSMLTDGAGGSAGMVACALCSHTIARHHLQSPLRARPPIPSIHHRVRLPPGWVQPDERKGHLQDSHQACIKTSRTSMVTQQCRLCMPTPCTIRSSTAANCTPLGCRFRFQVAVLRSGSRSGSWTRASSSTWQDKPTHTGPFPPGGPVTDPDSCQTSPGALWVLQQQHHTCVRAPVHTATHLQPTPTPVPQTSRLPAFRF